MTIVSGGSASPTPTPERCGAPSRPTPHLAHPEALAGRTGRVSGPAPKRRELSLAVAALAFTWLKFVREARR